MAAHESIVDKLDKVEQLLKHLPGKHNQQSHAGDRGEAGTAKGSSMSGASINAGGTDLTWESEDTIKGTVIIEFDKETDTDGISEADLKEFISDKLPGAGGVGGAQAHLKKGDIEEVSIEDKDSGKDWISMEVDITPTVEAGERWLDVAGGEEEWGLYHGQ